MCNVVFLELPASVKTYLWEVGYLGMDGQIQRNSECFANWKDIPLGSLRTISPTSEYGSITGKIGKLY